MVKESDPWAIMSRYNWVNGSYVDEGKFLITNVFRNQWGFQGLVMSDWGATHSPLESLNAGHDLEMPAVFRTKLNITSALQSGQLHPCI
jgi:beta-glucosidase